MNSAIGFSVIYSGSPDQITAAGGAMRQAIAYFDDVDQLATNLGKTELHIWGRGDLSECLHTLPDGSLLALVGSPLGEATWTTIQESMSIASSPADFELPWDGRVILLKISPDGERWTLWNDWLGSIPVFRAPLRQGRIASSLEPAVVAAADYTANDVSLPSLVSLLINGNFLGDWTLFKEMKVVPPDCVAEWDSSGFNWKQYFTVKPTDERWEMGWDELVDEMYELSRQAIADVLRTQPAWILPLSGGLDSRLIAAVGAEMGVEMHTYTWGAKDSLDTMYARQIATSLGLPWKWLDLGANYLVKYVRHWADLFGSAMHFHGMYQMPFLDALSSEPAGPIVSGYIGECLAGYDVRFQTVYFSSPDRKYQALPDGYIHWRAEDVRSLLKIQVDDALEELAAEIERQCDANPGPWFQRLRFLTLWGRQRHFTYFQSMLSDYWRGVVTPFLNREYARFSLSLPRSVLERRRLQAEVFQRYYRSVATIPNSYRNVPMVYNGSYFLKRRLAQQLPKAFLRGPLQGFNPSPLSMDGESVRGSGKAALWPIYDVPDCLGEWFDMDVIETVYKQALTGDVRCVRKLQSIQTFAYRLLDAQCNQFYVTPI